jgi:hypothetical protein
VTDVSGLGAVYDLNISWCHRISDFSGLGRGNYLLNLSYTAISSIDHLKSVHSLDLRGCTKLGNLKGIANVPIVLLQDLKKFNAFNKDRDADGRKKYSTKP